MYLITKKEYISA